MIDLKKIIAKFGTPIYVYDGDKIRENYKQIVDSIPYPNKRVLYAVMSNSNPNILQVIKGLGASVQINSFYELNLVKKAGFISDRVSFTSVGLDREGLKRLVQEGVQASLDSVEEVKKYCNLNPEGKFGIRIKMREDIELPNGHTNSPRDSDIGISEKDFERVKNIAEKQGCRVNAIHGYLASNILTLEPFIYSSNYIAECARQFPDLEHVNFGSGFGVPGRKTEIGLDLEKVGEHYSKLAKGLSTQFGRSIELRVEPGRLIMATAGTLYAKVTNVKQLKDKKQVAINAGFAEFARPRIYGAYHEIEVVGKEGETEIYDIRANTVLQSDFLGRDRELPRVKEGDILAIRNTGAYGIVMASGFPGKLKPREVIV